MSASSPLLELFRDECIKLGDGMVPNAGWDIVGKPTISLIIDELRGRGIGSANRQFIDAAKGYPRPFKVAIAWACAAHAPIAIESTGNASLAEELEEQLKALCERMDARVLRIPDCEIFLLDRVAARAGVANFLSSLLARKCSVAELEAISSSATVVVEQVMTGIEPATRALLAGIGSLTRSLTAEHAYAGGIGSTSRSAEVSSIFEQVEILMRGRSSLPSESSLRMKGGRATLVHGLRTNHMPEEWVARAREVREKFTGPRDKLPRLNEIYLDPLADPLHRPVEGPPAPGPTGVQDYVAAWLQFASDVPLVVLGDPGSGKTTTCRALVTRMLEQWEALPNKSHTMFPLYVPLRRLKDELKALLVRDSHERGRSLLSACITRAIDVASPFMDLSEEHPILLILDGFDELPLASPAEIQAFIDGVNILARAPGISVLVTGRPIAFEPYWPEIDEGSLQGRRWRRIRLRPFSRGPAGTCEQFVSRWLLASATAGVPVNAADFLLDIAHDGGGFSNMVETPVLLSLICALATGREALADKPPASLTDSYAVTEWLVLSAIHRRANASDRDRKPITPAEFGSRRQQYGRWAWDAVLHLGVEFVASAVESQRDSAKDTGLVEFLFTNGAVDAFEFMHRSVAEFLAADYFVSALVNETDDDKTFDFLIKIAVALARISVVLDANVKTMMSRRIQSLQKKQREAVCTIANNYLTALYETPSRLVHNSGVSTPQLLGAGAEIALLIAMAATGGEPGSDVIHRAIELRNYSPRRSSAWNLSDAPLRLVADNFEGQELVGFNFGSCRLDRVNFRKANLLNARFVGAIVGSCGFGAANLSNADFTGAVITQSDFANARLHDADFTDTRLMNCSLSPEQLASCKVRPVTNGSQPDVGSIVRGGSARGRRALAKAVGAFLGQPVDDHGREFMRWTRSSADPWDAGFACSCFFRAASQQTVQGKDGNQIPVTPEDNWLGGHQTANEMVAFFKDSERRLGTQLFFASGQSYQPLPGDLMFVREQQSFIKVGIVHHFNDGVVHVLVGDSDIDSANKRSVELWSTHLKRSYAFAHVPDDS